MKKTVCELCDKDVVRDDDIRYIDFTKVATGNEIGRTKGDIIPTKPAKEICTICAEIAYKVMLGADYGKDN